MLPCLAEQGNAPGQGSSPPPAIHNQQVAPVRSAVPAVVALAALLVGGLAGASSSENYRYRRTAAEDAKAVRVLVRKDDFANPEQVHGGRNRPDEGPLPAADRCDGRARKQSDLVVVGDASSEFSIPGAWSMLSRVRRFKTPSMALTDWKRFVAVTTGHCVAYEGAHESPPAAVLGFSKITPLGGVRNAGWIYELEYRQQSLAPVRFVVVLSAVVRGRTWAMIQTTLRESVPHAAELALQEQASALRAVSRRLPAT
jgi:hypothetical protein